MVSLSISLYTKSKDAYNIRQIFKVKHDKCSNLDLLGLSKASVPIHVFQASDIYKEAEIAACSWARNSRKVERV